MSEGPKYNMYFCRLSLLLYLCLIVTISHGKYLRVHDEGEHDEGGFQWETESEGSLLGDNEMDKTNDNVVADVGGERGELIENIFSDDSWAWRFTRNSPPAVNDTNFEALKYGFPSDKNFSEICPKRVSLEPHITVEDVVQSFVEGCTKAKGNESQCEIQRVKQYKIDTDELFKTFTDHPKSVRELYDLQGISQADLFQCLVYKSCTTRKGQSDLCPRPCSSSPCSKVENALEGCIVKGFGLLVSDWDCFCKPGYAWDPEEKNCEALEAEVSPSSPVSLQATRPSYTSPKSHSFTTDSNSSDLHIFHSRVKRAPWYSFKNSDWKVVKGGCNRKTFYRSKYDNKAKCAHKCWHHKSCISFVLIIPRNKYQRKQYTCFLKNALCKKVGNSLGRLMYVYIKSSFVPKPRPPPTRLPPVPGWKAWGPWHSCRPSCGMTHTRKSYSYRSCNAQPCVGNRMRFKYCKNAACPISGIWTSWTSWTACPVTCNGAKLVRRRVCNYKRPGEAYSKGKKAPCPGSSEHWKTCNSSPCPTWPPTTAWDVTILLAKTTMSAAKRKEKEKWRKIGAERQAYDRKVLKKLDNKEATMKKEYDTYIKKTKEREEEMKKQKLELEAKQREMKEMKAKHKKGKSAMQTHVPSGSKMNKLMDKLAASKEEEEDEEDSDNGTKVMVGLAAAAGVVLILIVIVVATRKKEKPPPPAPVAAPVAYYH